ncbi:hypothetical protein LM597_01420 [Candidatus Acetothermia bacterium]|nr:hypothetical protein [Candidatus Acetothermia bacterium]
MIVKEDSKTILLTTHNMKLAEELGDKFAFLNKGKIIWQGTRDELENLPAFKRGGGWRKPIKALSQHKHVPLCVKGGIPKKIARAMVL